MRVKVRFLGELRNFVCKRQSEVILDLKPGSRVLDVMERFNIPKGEVMICCVNDRHVGSNQILHEGDTLLLVPPIGGG